jgi:hypothetical protein
MSMKSRQIMTRPFRHFSIVSVALAVSAAGLNAKDKHSKQQAPEEDQIEVVANIPTSGGAITRFFTTEHYRRDYLYAEHAEGKDLTLLDVTRAERPTVLADVLSPNGQAAGQVAGGGSLVAVTGNAALVTSLPSSTASTTPQTFRILNFTDPLHPTVKQEFTGVTAMARDEKRGLIFLANDRGVWILREHYAMDPEFVKEWEHMMLDNR